MANQENLFSEFSSIEQEEWLAKINADLKGKAYETLNWEITPDMILPPVFGIEDRPESIAIKRSSNQWEIGEHIEVSNQKTANKQALDALMNGTNALCFHISTVPNSTALNLLLKDIQANYISMHFALEQTVSIAEFTQVLNNYLKEENLIKGSIYSIENNLTQLKSLLSDPPKQLSGFHFIKITVEDLSDPVEALAKSITEVNRIIEELLAEGIDLDLIIPRIKFSMECGKRYFVEIAKVRALHILWANILEAYSKAPETAHLEINTSMSAYEESTNDNMISATTIAMSAIIGGCDRLFIHPANSKTAEPSNFTRRIARNIQHIFQMESYLDRVVDPTAGSYYLENLTKTLVEKSWEAFSKNH